MPAENDPLVSIVMPFYKAERFMAESIESCLKQTYQKIELILVNDCSPDNSLAIARSMAERDGRIRVVERESNGGIARAFNTGFEAARGVYLTRLAADDLFYPAAVEVMVREMEGHPGVGLVYCDMEQIDEEGRVLYPLPSNPPDRALLPRNRIGLCLMWSRAVWEKIGVFEPRLDLAEDYDYWLRIWLEYPIHQIEGPPQLGFRIHQAQNSIQRAKRLTLSTMRAQMRYRLGLARQSPGSVSLWWKFGRSAARVIVQSVTSSKDAPRG